MFLSQIPVHTAVPTTLSPGFDPSNENTTPFLSPSVLLRREKELANARRGWFKNGPEGAAVVYHIAAIALNRVFTRRWLRLFNLAGMPGFRGIESFWKGETRHPPRQILYRRFTVRMKSEFRRGGSGLDSLLSLSLVSNFCSLSRFLERVRSTKWNILWMFGFLFSYFGSRCTFP